MACSAAWDMPDEIVISSAPGETRLVLLVDGRPVEFIIDRGEATSGDVVLGRVLSVNRRLDAAFVEIGDSQPGFLGAPRRLSEGDPVLVQVTAAARGAKGASLTAAPSLAGRWLVFTPFRPGLNLSRRVTDEAERTRLATALGRERAAGEGVVVRTEAAGVSDHDLLGELRILRQRWQTIAASAAQTVPPAALYRTPAVARLLADAPSVERIVVDDPAKLTELRAVFSIVEVRRDAFERSGAAEALEAALEPRVPLPGGGALIIEQTAAVTVIDVDSGGGSALDANLAAVPEIARQLRLRGLAGHILVDVIPLGDRRTLGRLVEELRKAVAGDPTPTRVIGATPLGLVEMTRDRRRPSLAEIMLAATAPQPNAETIGLEGLRAILREAAERPAARLALAAAPAVIAALRRRPAALAEAARRLGRPLALKEDAGLALFDLVEERP